MFYGLRYTIPGKYFINATSSKTSSTNSSDIFGVIEAQKTIRIGFPDEIMQNTVYLIYINITDQFGLNWLDDFS